MTIKTRLLVVLMFMAAWAHADDAVVQHLEISQPRAAGYQLGDKFERVISLRLRSPYKLSTAELVPGRVNFWLAMEAPIVSETTSGDSNAYTIRLVYQVINYTTETSNIPVPIQYLLATHGDESIKVQLRPTRTVLSPIAVPERLEMHPDRAPTARPQPLALMIAAWFVFLASALALVSIYWRIPLGSRKQPFTAAYHELKRLPASWDAAQARTAFEALHQAFNQTAGKTLFENEVAAFLDEHEQYAHLKPAIVDYFEQSRLFFYTRAAADIAAGDLLELARSCSDAERGISP